MTEKKDFTAIHDLGEFEHDDDPDTEAQLAEEFHSKTTVTSLDELDDFNDSGNESPIDEDPPEEFQYSTDDSENEFSEGFSEEFSEDEQFSSEDSTDEFQVDSGEEFSNESEDFSNDSLEPEETMGFDESGDSNNLNDSTTESFHSDESDQFQTEETDNFQSDEYSLDSSDETEEFNNETDNSSVEEQADFTSTQSDDFEESALLEDEQTIEEPNEFPAQDMQETFEDSMSSPIPAVDESMPSKMPSAIPEMSSPSTAETGFMTTQESNQTYNQNNSQMLAQIEGTHQMAGIGSLSSDELTNLNDHRNDLVAKGISDNIPEIPRLSTTYMDFRKDVENLSYAPSPEATGPLFAIQISGPLDYYKDHIQSIFDEYQVGVNLNEETYLMPLKAGFIQVSRISEYIAIQLTNGLSKYGLIIESYYLEDIISGDNIEELETKGIESEFNLPQNLSDSAEFAPQNDWDEDDILITVSSGPKGYKVLKRCGVAQKMITLPRKDFENLQVNLTEFFSEDIHMNGSSTLLDGLIEKIHSDLKEDARNMGANCMVNFKLEQTLDINVVILHFTADLLYLRKLNEY